MQSYGDSVQLQREGSSMAYERSYKVSIHSKKLVMFNFLTISLSALLANMVKVLLYSYTCVPNIFLIFDIHFIDNYLFTFRSLILICYFAHTTYLCFEIW